MSKNDLPALGHAPDRRSVLGAGALLAGAGLVAATGAVAGEKGHEGHMDHSQHTGHAHGAEQGDVLGKYKALVEAAGQCIKLGEVCAAHCVQSLSKGDTSLAACLKTVLASLPMCDALIHFAAMDAPRLKELAKVCMDVCDDCEKECKKHADHHAICKACGEACAACIKECKSLIEA